MKTYAICLVAATNKTVASIAREVLSIQDKRALNKFLTEYDCDEQQFNHKRSEEVQKHGETRWSNDGYIIIDDTITGKARDEVPGVGHLYDHAKGDTVCGQDPIYTFYADNKPAYPSTFRLYKQQNEETQDHDTKYDLAREIVTELEEEVSVRRHTYLFDSLKETVYNLLSWVRDNDDCGVDDPIQKIDHPFVHSTTDANVQA